MDVSLNAGQLVQQSRNVPGSHHDLELLLTRDRQINVAVSLNSLRQILLSDSSTWRDRRVRQLFREGMIDRYFELYFLL